MIYGGLYIHIPFCIQKCLYCDFPSEPGADEVKRAAYTAALIRQIGLWRKRFPSFVPKTIYIGGGTPSLLSNAQLQAVVAALETSGWWQSAEERSIEANPGTVSLSKLQMMRSLGVNRISFGVQSFSNRLLKEIGRIHTAAQAVTAVEEAAQAGFSRINVDLMYGLPNQTTDDWADTLKRAVHLPVEHISAYALTVEEGTPLATKVRQNQDYLPDEDTTAMMQELTEPQLAANGFMRYEISNYAKDGAVCLHNMGYWRYQPYLGLGAAAVSTWRGRRWRTTEKPDDYLRDAERHLFETCEEEVLTHDERLGEYIFLGLRTVEGVSLRAINKRFNIRFQTKFAKQTKQLLACGWAVLEQGRLRLTTEGMKWGNQAFTLFLPD